MARSETLRGLWVVAYREVLRYVTERSRIVGSLMMPLLLLVVFGAGFTNVIGGMAPGIDYIQFMYPGIIAITVLTTSLMAGVSVVWDREYGFLREILVAPISRTGIVLGKAVGATIQATIQVAIMLVLAPILGVQLDLGIILGLLPMIVILSLGLSGLGILLASFMRSQQGFQTVMQIIIFPLIFLAGVFFPVNNVPLWMELISKVNPLTYGVDAVRQVFLGADVSAVGLGVTLGGHTFTMAQDVLVVAVMSTITLTGAMWAFNRQE
jgi:ABC-2 type transport system permease protein